MLITQVIHGIHNSSAGPTHSVARLTDELRKSGQEAAILTLGQPPSVWPYSAPLRIHDGAIERGIGISMSLLRDVRRLSNQSCILHGHGIWRLTNLFPLVLRRTAMARIVCSPRGTLSAWSMQYKALVKRPFWHLLQKPALDRCDCFHATAYSELADIRRLGLRKPVAVIPNGIDVPELPAGLQRGKRLVFLSRIDPVKGVDLLLHAWAAVADDFPDWELVIAGPITTGYAASMQELAKKLRAPRVNFVGEMQGEAKRRLLFGASSFVLPTHSENFGIAVAEALAHGLPVITTTRTPWTELSGRNCGWCITPDEDALREVLRDVLSRPLPELHKMGASGRDWMERNYAWGRVAEMMMQSYEWLLYGAAKPDWIITTQ